MQPIKTRIFATVLILIGLGLIYYNWHQLWQAGHYSLKIAAFAPLTAIGGFYLLLFPGMSGKPATTREKILSLVVMGIGMLVGLINWYFMDPGFFVR